MGKIVNVNKRDLLPREDERAKEIIECLQKEGENSHLFNISYVPRTWHYYLIFLIVFMI